MKKFFLLVIIVLAIPSFGIAEGSQNARFNFLSGDIELMRGCNITRGGMVWQDSVQGNVGDEFKGVIYYHNGILDTVAHNTTLRVDLPSMFGTILNIKSWIWSDETGPVSDTVVDGQIVGLSGLNINLDREANLAYIPGSTNWYPGGASAPTHLPDGITNGGTNIGSIQGCWEFAGFVTFGFRAEAVPEPSSLLALGGGLVGLAGVFRRR